MNEQTIDDLKRAFPFPWQYRHFANGLFQVCDSHGKEVPIPTLCNFLVTITNVMANQTQQETPA